MPRCADSVAASCCRSFSLMTRRRPRRRRARVASADSRTEPTRRCRGSPASSTTGSTSWPPSGGYPGRVALAVSLRMRARAPLPRGMRCRRGVRCPRRGGLGCWIRGFWRFGGSEMPRAGAAPCGGTELTLVNATWLSGSRLTALKSKNATRLTRPERELVNGSRIRSIDPEPKNTANRMSA